MKSETDALKDLYTTLIDSREGYETAAEAVESHHLKSCFQDLAAKRADDAAVVRKFLASEGVTLDDDSSILGTAHRHYVSLKDNLGGDDESIIAEVIRGEEHLLSTYDKAIQPMTSQTEAYIFATGHHATLKSRLEELRAEKKKAA